jgi:hypothetical protein
MTWGGAGLSPVGYDAGQSARICFEVDHYSNLLEVATFTSNYIRAAILLKDSPGKP